MNPSIKIANGAPFTSTRNVTLNLSVTGSNLRMKLSEDPNFNGVDWQPYLATPTFQLSTGDGTKKVYAKFKNDFEIESASVHDDIIMDTTPPTAALTITPTSGITNETSFQFDPTASHDNLAPQSDLRVRYDYENDGTFDTDWEELRITNYEFQIGGGDKTVKMQLKDGAGWTAEATINVLSIPARRRSLPLIVIIIITVYTTLTPRPVMITKTGIICTTAGILTATVRGIPTGCRRILLAMNILIMVLIRLN